MGAGSSTEPRSPQDETNAAGDSQPGSPGDRTPTEAAPEAGEPEDSSKILHENGQISSISEITKEHVELSHEPEVLKEQQAVLTLEVGETKAANLILEEESAENIKTSSPELNDKSNEDEVQKDTEDADKQLASEEKEDQPSVSPSNDVGFKKVFKLVGFKFTVKKDKTEKIEPVQLLDVKPEVAEGSSDVAGEDKQLKTETVGEATESEITASVDKTEEETQAEEMERETSSEKVTESPVDAESKEAEIKNNGIKSLESPVSPLNNDTASPLRKFFSQSWAGFRKRTSFRKSKEEVQTEKEKQDQEMEKDVTTEVIIVEEELEREKLTPEKDETEVSCQASDEKIESEEEREEETKMVEVPTETDLKEAATPSEQTSAEELDENINKDISFEASDEKLEGEKERKEETKVIKVPTETDLKEAATPSEQPSAEELAENINKEISFEASDEKMESEKERKVSSETDLEKAATPRKQPSVEQLAENIKAVDIILKRLTDLESKKKLEQVQKSPIGIEQSIVVLHESKTELLHEAFEEKTNQLDSLSPVAIEKPEEPSEIIEEKPEPKAPLATEIFDEKPREINIDVRAVVTEEESQITKKEQLVLEQLVETNDDFQKEQPTVEQLKITETVLEIPKEHFIQTDSSSLDAATDKPPEGIITSEVELLSSQEKAKMQGSPLKKLFTGPGLKKLSRKKRKGKKEAKSEEAAEEAQQLSDTAESPDDPRGESSASSPEEITESIEKSSDAAQIPEAKEGFPSDAEKKRESVTPWASFKKMVTPKKRVRRLSDGDREEELDKTTESAPSDEQEDIKENGEEQKLEKSADEPKKKVDTSVSWEALICVGSSKRRSRKSSSSDEETEQRLAQDEQKLDESAPNKEAVPDTVFTSSHESDQGQGSSSPEQAGSPSETEGISTWESLKRLVTPRRKSKTRMEEKNDEPIPVPSLEHATLDGDTGKEESWVSFKKLMPGRRKKKSDGIPEHAPVLEAGEETTGTNEEDFDVPAVVPLSEYDAAEQEKFEAQKAEQDDMDKEIASQNIEKSESTSITQQVTEGLVHAVAVSVVEGERAIISIEERSPSWIPAAVTVSTELVNDDEEQSEQIFGTGIVEEIAAVTKLVPQMRKDISGDSIIGDLELTSEAVTAREEASIIEETTEVSCAKETTEMSCAEETTEMISAVSRLTESPDTTEIATPVQEIEENEQDLEELNKQTQQMLQIVAERIKLSDEKGISASLTEATVQSLSAKEETEQELMTSKGTPSAEFPKDVRLKTIESRAYKIVQKIIQNAVAQFHQESIVLSKQENETAVLYPDPDKLAFYEQINLVLEESADRYTREGALQMGASGSHLEMEVPKSSSDEETEENVMTSEGIPSIEFPKDLQPETIESQAYKIVQIIIQKAVAQFQQESMTVLKQKSEMAVLCPDPDTMAFSEKIDSALEESAGICTREGALQMGASGSPPEMELPKSSFDEEIEQKVMTSGGVLTSTEFPKDLPPETIESQAYKIAQRIIENAVAQLQESMALLKKKSESAVLYFDLDKVPFSKKIDSVPEESAGICTRDGALQVGVSGSPSEMELLPSSSEEEIEQKVMTLEGLSTSTDFPKGVQPETTESQAYKIAQIIIQYAVAQFQHESMALSKQRRETAVLYPDPDKVAFSEKIGSVLEESAGRRTRESVLQISSSGSPPEMELPTSSPVEEAEKKVITLEGIPSTEFPKDVQPETIESESLKVVQEVSAVVKFQQEPMAFSKQKSETAVLYPDPVEFSEEIDLALEESLEKFTRDSALQMSTSGPPLEMELPKSSSKEETVEKVMMTSEGIPSAEFTEESKGKCTKEDLLQSGTCGSPPEMDLPISSAQEEIEEKVMTSEGVSTSTDFPKVILPETTESQAYKIVQIIIQYALAQFQHESMALSKQKRETAALYPDPDKLAFSEKIDSVLEESSGRRTRESVLQIGSSGLHPEIELPTSSADEETEEHVMTSEGIPSTDFPKVILPESTESQAYKIAQIIIQNAVAQFQQESMALSKKKSETAVLCHDPNAVTFSGKIDLTLEESPGKCTIEDALQPGESGSLPEMEVPISSLDEETEEKVMMTSERIPSAEFPKNVEFEAIESQAYKIVQIIIQNAVAQFQQESMALSKQKYDTVVMYHDSDALAFSEKIDSMLEEGSGRRTRESALQTSTSGSPSEMEVPTSSTDKATEEEVMTSERIPFTEFQKDVLPETIESRAYKLVQIIIQNAIAQFKQESIPLSKQKSETPILYPDPDKLAFYEQINLVLEESPDKCTTEGALQTGAFGSPPEMELPKSLYKKQTEEKVMASEDIPSTEFPEESGGRCTTEGALQTDASGSPPEMELPKSLSEKQTEEKGMASEEIPSTEFPEESGGICTTEGALQTDASGSPPEMELPKSLSEKQTEEKGMASEDIPSTEFPEESEGRCTTEGALQTGASGSPPEMELPKSLSEKQTEEKGMASEDIPSTEFPEESGGICTTEGALQTDASGSPPEMELPKSLSEKQTEEKVTPSEGIPSTEFPEESRERCTTEVALHTGASRSPPEMELPKSLSEKQTEEKVMASEGISSTEFPEESGGSCTTEGALQTGASGSPPEMERPKSSSEEETEEKVMPSEGIPSTEFPEESEGRCTIEGALQIGASGSLPEMELPKSLSEKQTEEKGMAEDIPSTEFPEESGGRCTIEGELQTGASGSLPEMELPKSSSDEEIGEKLMPSEGIPSTEFPEESKGRCTIEGALQTDASGSPPEIELPKSLSEKQTEEKMMASEDIPSTEFPEKSEGRCTIEGELQTGASGSPPEIELPKSLSEKQTEEKVMASEDIPSTEFPEKSEGRCTIEGALQTDASGSPPEIELPKSLSEKQTEEKVMASEDIPSTEFPEKSEGRCTIEGALQTDASGSPPEIELPKSLSEKQTEEKVMASEDIPSTEFPEESEGRCTTEGALQTGASGSPPEMELPKSLSEKQTEEKGMASEDIPSTEFPEESGGICTTEGALQTDASGSPPEMELPKSLSEKQTEEKVTPSEGIPSTEFPEESRERCTTEVALHTGASRSPPEMELPKSLSEKQTEEKVMASEGISSTEFPEESGGSCTTEGALQTGASGSPPEMERPKSSSEEETEEKVMPSEGIPSTEFPEESEGRCTIEGALQIGASGSLPEMELPKSLSEKQTEEKGMASEDIPSTEFPEESGGRCTIEGELQTGASGSLPEMELPKSSSDEEIGEKLMPSEGIPSTEFPEESKGRCTIEGALQTDASGSPPEIELPKSLSEKQTEEKMMASEDIPSTEFPEKSEGRCTIEGELQTGASGSPPEIELPKSLSEKQTEEKVMASEDIPSTEFPEKSEGRCTIEGALQTDASGSPPEIELPKSLSEKQTEEKVMASEDIPSTEFPEKSEGRCTIEGALQTDASGSPPEIELPKSLSEKQTEEKVMASEGISSTEFPEESEGRCTIEGALQTDASGSPPEMELPKSLSEKQTEEKVTPSEGISSTEFPEESGGRCTIEVALQTGASGSPLEMELPKSLSEKQTEENVMASEGIHSIEFPEESGGICTIEGALQTGPSVSLPEMDLPKSSSDEEIGEKVMASEGISSTEFPEESGGRCTIEVALQTGASGSPPKMELPKSFSEKQTEEKVTPSEGISSTEFPKESGGKCTIEVALQTGASGSPLEMELPKSLSEKQTEENVMASEGIHSIEFPEESGRICTIEGALQTGPSVSLPEMDLPKSSSDEEIGEKVMASEGISSTEFPEESGGRCTIEVALQTGASGSPPKMELPKSFSEKQTEEKVMPSEGIPSTEFPEESEGKCPREGTLQMGTSESPPEMELPKLSSEEETEEKMMTSRGIPCTDFSKELERKYTTEGTLQMRTSGSPPEIELSKSSSEVETEEKVMMTSEEIPSAEFAGESAERCTREDSLQTGTSQSPPEMELLTSSSQKEAKQKVMTSEGVQTSTEFPEYVQLETIVFQSYKIVQKVSPVAQFQQSQEDISPLKQKSELCLKGLNEFGIPEVLKVGQQISRAEEKSHKIQPTTINAEREEAIEVAKGIPSCSIVSEERENWNFRKTDADHETVKENVNEMESKKYDSKPQLKADVVVAAETQNIVLGSIVSGDHPVGSLETEQSTIKDLEVGLIDENQDKLIEHQTQRKRKEDYSQSTEFPEMPKEEDTTSGDSPQLQTKLGKF
ncbi:LOW QUALITY PROTEIN: A-kinase anchor protein 12 [Ahaetulla prasina]|uniref:LOW QUALITY PROTEIN: A-kinase anchor protein 12 n=1 Tax=Ahaetulla prasina TaxID=499056 RepID=UPI002648FA6D|nr:LOW QUALITY PROTEIN: A-kinase anchor protein 12 [Ahaetulla prasina]